MNKKDTVRTYLLNMDDGSKFNATSLCDWVNKANKRKDITEKDISNAVLPLLKNGAITREKSDSSQFHFVYTIIKNNVALWFAKHPIIGRERKPNRVDTEDQKVFAGQKTLPTTIARKKNRSSFVISIDAEIADLQCKIKRLNTIRKEFA